MGTETVGEAFRDFLQGRGYGTFGVDLYLGNIPLDAPDNAWLITVAGGNPETVTLDGSMMKLYTFSVYRRAAKGVDIERDLFSLEETLNCASCLNLDGFETIYSRATQFAQDTDLENENRRIGLLQAQVKLFKQNKTKG